MENLEQWIIAIVGLGVAFAPTLTAYFNNKTQYKISKLNTLYSTKIGYVNDYFENLSITMTNPENLDALQNYLSSAQKLYIVVDDECRKSIDEITNILLNNENYDYSKELIESLTPKMDKLSKDITKCIE